jgi:hypothetical protein
VARAIEVGADVTHLRRNPYPTPLAAFRGFKMSSPDA